MADFNASNPVSVGDATKKRAYDRVFDNAVANKERRAVHHLGGAHEGVIVSATMVDLAGAVHVEIDGTNLGGHTVELHVMARVDAGTGTIELFNVTTSAAMTPNISVTATTYTFLKSGAITLTTGVNVYKVRAHKGTNEIQVYGAALVIR